MFLKFSNLWKNRSSKEIGIQLRRFCKKNFELISGFVSSSLAENRFAEAANSTFADAVINKNVCLKIEQL